MKNNMKRLLLEQFVCKAHKGQVRKYSKEEYFNHVRRVSRMLDTHLKDYKSPKRLMKEVALCHDLIEDTDVTCIK